MQALGGDVCLDQQPPRPPCSPSHVLQAWISPLCLLLSAHFLPLLLTERFGTRNLAAYAIWQTKSLEGRCSLSDITTQTSRTGACPCPHLSRLFPSTAFALLRRQFSYSSLPAGTPSHFLPLCRPLLLPFPFHLIYESFTNGISLGQKKKKKGCKERLLAAQLWPEMVLAFVRLSVQPNAHIPLISCICSLKPSTLISFFQDMPSASNLVLKVRGTILLNSTQCNVL